MKNNQLSFILEPLTKRPKLPETASREKTDVVPKPIPHTITDEDILRVSAATHPFPQFKVNFLPFQIDLIVDAALIVVVSRGRASGGQGATVPIALE